MTNKNDLITERRQMLEQAGLPLPEPMLTADEVAKLVKVTTRTLRRMVRDGRFPAPRKLGITLRWPAEQIRRIVSTPGEAAWQHVRNDIEYLEFMYPDRPELVEQAKQRLAAASAVEFPSEG